MNEVVLIGVVPFLLALCHALVLNGMRDRVRHELDQREGQARDGSGDQVRVSVVVPVRDGAATIGRLLQDLYAQDHPRTQLEVWVVDDGSTDRTEAIVRGMMPRWPELHWVAARGEGKKAAITTGVAMARGELVLLTDADVRCGPARVGDVAQEWQRTNVDLLLMPIAVEGAGWLGRVQGDEQAAMTWVGAAAALEGRPLLANGANMAFRKKAFEQVGGYSGDHRSSGDDLFLLERFQKAGLSMGYLLDPRVVVRTDAEHDVPGFWRQRLRWAGKMRAFPLVRTLPVLLVLLFPWVLSALTIHVVCTTQVGQHLLYKAGFLAAAWVLWLAPVPALVREARGMLRTPYSAWGAVVSFLCFSVYAVVVTVVSFFVRPQWKGRRVR